jgi:hypothetical protein
MSISRNDGWRSILAACTVAASVACAAPGAQAQDLQAQDLLARDLQTQDLMNAQPRGFCLKSQRRADVARRDNQTRQH